MLGWGLCEDGNEAGDFKLINCDESSFSIGRNFSTAGGSGIPNLTGSGLPVPSGMG